MKHRLLSVVTTILVIMLVVSSCNLPRRISKASETVKPTSIDIMQGTPTPTSLCANAYFPNATGDRWEYSGSNTIAGDYIRTDAITVSSNTSFTQDTSQGNVSFSVSYDCTSTGIISTNPVQQYAGALLDSPNTPVNVQLTSNSGTSLPVKINPGDSWQQTADFEAASQKLNVSGRFVFDYTAVGYEAVTVPAGTYNALKINTTIRIEVTGLHILAGTYTTTSWLVADIGLVKSEGTSQVTGVDFSDRLQLTSFSPAR